jgi:hypothetical protein
VTPEEALHKAREISRNPGSVTPFAHAELENARHGRGYAFRQVILADHGDIDGYVLIGANGGLATGIFGEGETIESVIAAHLAKAAHDHREVPAAELGVPQRLALAAFEADGQLDAATVDYARYLLIIMRRSGKAVLAREDSLLRAPEADHRYTHPCPLCARPAMHQARYPRAVCDDCHGRTTDRVGRRVAGSNIDMSGGFVARYVDPPREHCAEVTSTGRCYIDGHEVTMGEARFGGIVVEAR